MSGTQSIPGKTRLDVYLFRDRHFAPAADTVVCIGDRETIEGLCGQSWLDREFEGMAVYVDDLTEKDLMGVWGARKASRLRTLLRAKGADLVIRNERPLTVRLRFSQSR